MCKDFPFFKVVLVILTSCHLIHLKEIRQISLPDIIGHIIFIFAVNFFRDLIQPKSNRSNHITLFKLIEKGDTEGFIKFQKENFTNVNELHTCYIYVRYF